MKPKKGPIPIDLPGNPTILVSYAMYSAYVVHYGVSDANLKEGKQMVIENLSQLKDPCEGATGVSSSYAEILLKENKLTDIFMVLVPSEKGVISVGFALCTQEEKHGILIELSLTCSNKTGFSLNVSGMLLIEMLSFYRRSNRSIRLYALHFTLLFLYYNFGFVLLPLDQGCAYLTQSYISKWNNLMKPLSKAFKKLSPNNKEDIDKNANLDRALFSPLNKGKTREDYYWEIPGYVDLNGVEVEPENFGYYMVYCHNTNLDDIRTSFFQKIQSDTYQKNWQKFFEQYTFVTDPKKKDTLVQQVFGKPKERQPKSTTQKKRK